MQDDRITAHLPKDTFHVQHFISVAYSLIRAKRRIKFGITNDPYERFCVKSYAYTRESAQSADRTRYTAMVVVHVHHERDVVGSYEHSLIKMFDINPWCANRKFNFDNHIEFESDQGPHFLYISSGEPL